MSKNESVRQNPKMGFYDTQNNFWNPNVETESWEYNDYILHGISKEEFSIHPRIHSNSIKKLSLGITINKTMVHNGSQKRPLYRVFF